MKPVNPAADSHFTDVDEIRKRARENVKTGAVFEYKGDAKRAVKVLNEALATEMVCTLRYLAHYFNAEGIDAESVKEEFLEHAREEQKHAEQIAERIKQLNGTPDFNPDTLTQRSHAEFKVGETLVEMIEEDLIAERIAIESYREMIQFFGDTDPTSRRLMEQILAQEEEHAEELQSFLLTLDPRKKADSAA